MKKQKAIAMCLKTSVRVAIKSEKRICDRCAHDVWATPATLKLCNEHETTILCVECFEAMRPAAITIITSPEQMQELDHIVKRIRP